MAIIDAQVHAYERDHPGRPWAATLAGPAEVTGHDMVAAMDAVGVDGALLVSPWTMYRFDPSYALEVHAAHPGRFALITPVDPRREDVGDVVADWAGTPGAVGVRLVLWRDAESYAEDPGVHRVVSAAARHGVPLCLLCWGRLSLAGELAARHPDAQLVIDHLGLHQPFEPPPPAEPFADLPALLALARHPNVAVKVTGAATLSLQPFPFGDLWEPLGRLFDAFGVDRCMWGTDWTRATALVSYADAVAAFRDTDRLSGGDRAALMGGTLQRVFGWAPSGGPHGP
ncbi:MAG: amidohydrolase family protein [Acidimicrobiia bacterium]|nr:amidohydrolase family protein [Acidimicrobiia bacterium]